MSSSYTTRKRIEKQNPGENSNTWGAILNTDTIDIIDECFGVASVQFGSSVGDKVLSTANGATDKGRRSIIKIIGTPASAVSLFVPAVQSFYFVDGKHTTKSVNVKANGGTVGVKFDALEKGLVYCNGTQVVEIYRTPSAGSFNGVPSGTIIAFKGSVGALPAGYVVCDGTNSTPNLSGKFILGATTDVNSGLTGGSQTPVVTSANISVGAVTGSHVLTSAEIPAHSHLMFSNYTENSTLATNTPYVAFAGFNSGSNNNYVMAGSVTVAQPTLGNTSWAYTSTASGHTHSISLEAGHTHVIADGRPPYYSLLYIMKS